MPLVPSFAPRARAVTPRNGNGNGQRIAVSLVPVDLAPGLEFVSTAANTPNQLTRILTARVPDRVSWTLVQGTAPNIKLAKSDGTEIARASRLVFGVRAPQQEAFDEVTSIDYAHFANLSLDQQDDERFNRSIRIVIPRPGGRIVIPEAHYLDVYLRSPDAVDWANPNTVFALRVWESRSRLA